MLLLTFLIFSGIRTAIYAQQLAADVTKSMETVHGKKYIVDGDLKNPVGKAARVRTIWIIDAGVDFPRLVTAYPSGR